MTTPLLNGTLPTTFRFSMTDVMTNKDQGRVSMIVVKGDKLVTVTYSMRIS